MWQLTSNKNFLFYHCAPELVVYNKSTRSTSLLPPLIAQIFSLIKDHKHIDILDLQEEIQGHFNVQIPVDDVEKSVNYLEELVLIEYSK